MGFLYLSMETIKIKNIMSKDKIANSLKIVDQIQKIRSKNNKNWMDLLRLSLRLDYAKTSKNFISNCSMIKKFQN